MQTQYQYWIKKLTAPQTGGRSTSEAIKMYKEENKLALDLEQQELILGRIK